MSKLSRAVRQGLPWYVRDLGIAERDALADRIAAFEAALAEIREVYAGSDGFEPETCPEAYLQRLLKQMYNIAVAAL